jgi:multidrug resistance efflux pump
MSLKAKLLAVVIVLAVAGAGLGLYWRLTDDSNVLRLPGTVETQEVRLSSRVGGRVVKIAVREGELVQAGQPLVYLEMPELQAQRDQFAAKLAAMEAQLDKARSGPRSEDKAAAAANLKAMEARWQKLKAGSRVEEIEHAKSEVAMVAAELVRARLSYERHKALPPAATSKAQLEIEEANYLRLQGQRLAVQAKLDLLLAGSRPEEIAEAEAEVARARAQYELLQAGTRSEELAEAEARVAELRGRLREIDVGIAELVVRAPEAAVVEILAVRPGDVVTPNQPVVRALRADDLWVKAYVSEIDLGKLRLNQTVELTIDAYPDRRYQGTITWIAAMSEFTPRNVQSVRERHHQVFAIKVRVDDPQGVFKSGMAADVWVTPATP